MPILNLGNKEGATFFVHMSHVRAAKPCIETHKLEGAPHWARPSQLRFDTSIWRISRGTILQ